MINFLKFRSRRYGYCGWALKHREALVPLAWTVCTTREEARALLESNRRTSLLWEDFEPVKVKIGIEVVNDA